MAPEVGLEPTTNRLTADRSTTELLRISGERRVNHSPALESTLLPIAKLGLENDPEPLHTLIARLGLGCGQASFCRVGVAAHYAKDARAA